MLKTSSKQGSGVDIGDYIDTTRSQLPDGKRLLNACTLQLLDPVEYPVLTAALGKTLACTNAFLSTAGIRIGYKSPAEADASFMQPPTNGQTRLDKILEDGSPAALYNDPAANHVCFAISDDGQEMYMAGGITDSLTTSSCNVVKSVDGGSNFSTTSLPLGRAVQFLRYGQAAVQCDSSGTNSLVAIFEGTAPYAVSFFRSTDSGTSYTKDATMSFAFANNGTFVPTFKISRDLGTVVFTTYSQTNDNLPPKLYRSQAGASFVDITANLELAGTWKIEHVRAFEMDASEDCQTLLVQVMRGSDGATGSYANATTVPTDPISHYTEFYYSTDGGDTFSRHTFQFPELVNLEEGLAVPPIFTLSSDGKYAVVYVPRPTGSSTDVQNLLKESRNPFYLIRLSDMRVEKLLLPVKTWVEGVDNFFYNEDRHYGMNLDEYAGKYYLYIAFGDITGTSRTRWFELSEDYFIPMPFQASNSLKIVADPQ